MSKTPRVPFIDLKPQHRPVARALEKAAARILRSHRFVLGDEGKRLESSIAKELGTKYAIGVASGSDALYLALWAAGVQQGDEVITTPFTFFATAGAISRLGAHPVFTDIDPDTFNIDPSKIESMITPRTKAIVPVHLYGLSCDMGPILSLAKKYKLKVIEDAAQSYGARYKGSQSGSMGDAGCLSFYPTKNFGGAGDGGMVVTSQDDLNERVRLCRDHGSRKKYIHEFVGINSRLDELQAGVLNIKQKYLQRWNAERRRLAAEYDKHLKGLPLRTPVAPKNCEHVFHLYTIVTEKRDALSVYLTSKNIGCGVYYPLPLHLQPCYKDLGYKKGDLPASEYAAAHALSLPMYNGLSLSAVRAVAQEIRSFFKKNP